MKREPKWYDGHLREFQETAYIRSMSEYEILYRKSLDDPDIFWADRAYEYLSWYREWDFVLRHDLEEAKIEWFGGGVLNASSNCLDRHVEKHGEKIAFHWEARERGHSEAVTYRELYDSVNKFAGVLKRLGVQKGDCVVIYMPMVVELVVAMLACARIGAVHCVICSGYGIESLAGRIQECRSRVVVTADGAYRDGTLFPLKKSLDEALRSCPQVTRVIVLSRYASSPGMSQDRDLFWHEAMSDPSIPSYVPPEPMRSEAPLFILFASPAIGKSRALVHTHGGYLLWAAMTAKLIFDLKEHDVFWSTADLGRITGHSLGVYGPLLNGMTSVLFEGEPSFPDFDRYWQIITDLNVSKFCTGPGLIRTLAEYGADSVDEYDLSSLKILGTAGERLTADAWEWFYDRVGKSRCPIMETWGQTETGGPMMSPLPGVAPLKPGSVSFPFFGVDPVILDLDTGEETKFPDQEGAFFIGRPWPGMARTIFGDREAYKDAYFAPFPGMFLTGDGALRDEDGYFWITGRIDDVINVAGHRIGAWEVEGALASHQAVMEATAVGFPHRIKGQGIYAFVTLGSRVQKSEKLKKELADLIVEKIGCMAVPEIIQWADALPKTRSGKILRRLLQKIAAGQTDDLGDLSTVADPSVIEALVRDRMGVTTR
jgi:acetyl-CoA synthetase